MQLVQQTLRGLDFVALLWVGILLKEMLGVQPVEKDTLTGGWAQRVVRTGISARSDPSEATIVAPTTLGLQLRSCVSTVSTIFGVGPPYFSPERRSIFALGRPLDPKIQLLDL